MRNFGLAPPHEAGKYDKNVGYVCDGERVCEERFEVAENSRGKLNMYKCNKSSDDYVELLFLLSDHPLSRFAFSL